MELDTAFEEWWADVGEISAAVPLGTTEMRRAHAFACYGGGWKAALKQAESGRTAPNMPSDAIAASERLCKIYFDIVAECVGESEVRRRVAAAPCQKLLTNGGKKETDLTEQEKSGTPLGEVTMKDFEIRVLCNHFEEMTGNRSASLRESWKLMRSEFYRLQSAVERQTTTNSALCKECSRLLSGECRPCVNSRVTECSGYRNADTVSP